MTDVARLRRAYRRLMWVYPRWYRRERGAEVVTTLLDDAAPGQRRPRLAEAYDLVRGGLLARFRVPRKVGSIVAALVLTLWTAIAGAALGVALSPYPGPPDQAAAVRAAIEATTLTPHDIPGPVVSCDAECPDPAPGDEVVSYDTAPDHTASVAVLYHPPAEQIPDVTTAAHQRLAALGWQVTPLLLQSDGYVSFTASNGTLVLYVVGDTAAGSTPMVSVDVSKGFSRPAVMALALGFAIGLPVGWLVAAWLLQRYRRHSMESRIGITVCGLPFLFLAFVSIAQTALMGFVMGMSEGGYTPKDVRIPEFVLTFLPSALPTAAIGVGAAALTALVLVARRPKGRFAGRSPQRPLPGTA